MRLRSTVCSFAGLAFAALALSQPSHAQERETVLLRTGDQPPGIIVEGERPIEKDEVRSALRDIAMRDRVYTRPLTQFQAPLCVSVAGLGTQFNAQVAERIRENSRQATVKVAEGNCQTNALVVVVKNPDLLIKRLRKEQPGLFDFRATQAIKAGQNRGDVAIGWSVGRINDKLGNPAGSSGSVVGAAGAAIFDNAGQGVPTINSLGTNSRSSISYSLERVFSVLIFDVERMAGVHLDQLADYSTVRLLGEPQPKIDLDETPQADSILTLFDMGPYEAPQEMTQLDRAYLRGLYSMRPNEPSTRLEKFVLAAYDDVRTEDCAAGRMQACPTPRSE